jgi:hypothetical protein
MRDTDVVGATTTTANVREAAPRVLRDAYPARDLKYQMSIMYRWDKTKLKPCLATTEERWDVTEVEQCL